ncbi:MAG TPA: non-homologous end-joining DNA ligase [Pyrinomonadaceae bacterium]|nr:non-homologous end-joining DNA ligase [Pyrinomonadaceae bacterium]
MMKVDLQALPTARLDFIPPMLARLVEDLPSGADWLYELKLDGYRTLVLKKRGVTTLFSRRGHILTNKFPTIALAFSFLPDDTMVDGELVVLDDQGKPSFSALQNSRFTPEALYFYVFDLIAFRKKDVRKLTLLERRRLLEDYALKGMRDPVRLSEVLNASPKTLVAAARKAGLEGVIAKRSSSRYESGDRSGSWVKYKTKNGQELVIGGYKPGSNGFEYLLVGYYEGKDLIFIAKIRNGFTPMLRRHVSQKFARLRTGECPFANLPERANARRGEAITADVMKKIQWLRPKLVAQIEFTEWTKGNHLRHSEFVALRDDKKAQEVVKELGTQG